jgi:hypothetical protein
MYSSYKTNSVKKNNKLYTKFDSWFLKNGMKIQSYLSSKKGNCLVESVSLFLDAWRSKPIKLVLKSISWVQNELL